VKERKLKNFWSDESEESEEELPVDFMTRQVDLEEYNYFRAERRRCKLVITKWVKKWREEHHGQNPSEESTAEIAMELADFNHANS